MKEEMIEGQGGMIGIEEIKEIIGIGEETLGGLKGEMVTLLGIKKEILIEDLEERILQIKGRVREMKGDMIGIIEKFIAEKKERILQGIVVLRREILQ